MKLIAFAVVVALAGCKKTDPVQTAGSGSSGSGSAVVVVNPPDAPIVPIDAAAPPCVIVVKLQIGKLSWDGGGISGNTDYKPGEIPHIEPMKAASPTCVVLFSAATDLKYQDIIAVIDAIVKIGLVDVQLGHDGDKAIASHTTRPQPNMDIKWAKGTDGKPALTGTVDKMSGNAPIASAPVLIISKTEVKLGADVLGKPDDADIATKLDAKLPANPKDPTVIIQADASTSAKTIMDVSGVLSAKGYTNVLFAVKTK